MSAQRLQLSTTGLQGFQHQFPRRVCVGHIPRLLSGAEISACLEPMLEAMGSRIQTRTALWEAVRGLSRE